MKQKTVGGTKEILLIYCSIKNSGDFYSKTELMLGDANDQAHREILKSASACH